MGYSGDAQVLIRIAVFGICISVISTAMISILLSTDTDGDYDFDAIQQYRAELQTFTGESMLNQTPWVLNGVYTPWLPEMGTDGHVTEDHWLYGESIEYPYLGKVQGIKLDKEHKSGILLGIDARTYEYLYEEGNIADNLGEFASLFDMINFPFTNLPGYDRSDYVRQGFLNLADLLGLDPTIYGVGEANMWNYTGYRYVFDPTLPFKDNEASVRDGALSIVWYSYQGQEGLSGALDVYGGNVLLASYSAADIISGYNTGSGYASHYTFNFDGAQIELYIEFDQTAIQNGMSLMEAWTDGQWSMAVSSLTVGNFLDLENSNSYITTGGGLVKTFAQIYTLSLPSIHNQWMDIILWLLVALPMTLSLAILSLKFIQAVKPL